MNKEDNQEDNHWKIIMTPKNEPCTLLTESQDSPQVTRRYLVYSGDYFEFSDGVTALKYDQVSKIFSEST